MIKLTSEQISEIQKAVKGLNKNQGDKLTTAYNKTAQKLGFKSWSDMLVQQKGLQNQKTSSLESLVRKFGLWELPPLPTEISFNDGDDPFSKKSHSAITVSSNSLEEDEWRELAQEWPDVEDVIEQVNSCEHDDHGFIELVFEYDNDILFTAAAINPSYSGEVNLSSESFPLSIMDGLELKYRIVDDNGKGGSLWYDSLVEFWEDAFSWSLPDNFNIEGWFETKTKATAYVKAIGFDKDQENVWCEFLEQATYPMYFCTDHGQLLSFHAPIQDVTSNDEGELKAFRSWLKDVHFGDWVFQLGISHDGKIIELDSDSMAKEELEGWVF